MTRADALCIARFACDELIDVAQAHRIFQGVQEAARKGHSGDCTKEAHTCAVCYLNRVREEATTILNYVDDQTK